MSPDERRIRIPGPAGNIDADLFLGNSDASFGCILTHPHPQYGGNMYNNVVEAVFDRLSSEGIPVIRFNFRGVGGSQGVYDGGEGEQLDTMAVCEYFEAHIPYISKIILIGYSFGAAIGCAIIDKCEKLSAYVAVSYPFTFISNYISDARTLKPKFFIMGSEDDFTSVDAFEQNYAAMPDPKQKKLVPDVDHFWSGMEEFLSDTIFDWLQKTFI